jgi:hypothetical protein
MSNQKKAEFVGDIFSIWSFWWGRGKILPKIRFTQEGAICPEMLIQRRVMFSTAVTHKLLTIWSHLTGHQKAERVLFRNGIQDFRSFSQSETGNSWSIPPLFYPETKFSSEVDRQNSVTSKLFSRKVIWVMVQKLGEFPKCSVVNSGTKSIGNNSVFTFYLLLFAFIQIYVFTCWAIDMG